VIEGRASRTSYMVALVRAAHQTLDQPLVFPDPLAPVIVGARQGAALPATPQTRRGSAWRKALRAHIAVRSRVAEDARASAVHAGVRQYVILGAGLDTFAYRNTNGALRVFEVDHPQTQAWKRNVLVDASIAVPPNVTYVPVNFERQDLAAELARAGLDSSAPTFFSWLGVTMYLTREPIRDTLRFVVGAMGSTGGIAFDYAEPPRWYRPLQAMGYWFMARRVARAGEPFRSLLKPPEVAAELGALGFATVADLGAAELNRRYFQARADGLRMRGRGHVVVAGGKGLVLP